MASLTPGVLSKLLDNVNNKHFKVAGDHRSALLQVIGIVPSLIVGDNDDGGGDPWQSKGFFVRVSDSVHSAYVSISDEDVDMILNDEIQLGQFVHVARLDSGKPVPVLRGVKPLPRRRPCVGNPKDLISSDSISTKTATKDCKIVKREEMGKPMVVKRAGMKGMEAKVKRSVVEESKKARRVSMENGKVEGLELRRLSLDSCRRGWDRPQSRSKPKETSSSLSDAVHVKDLDYQCGFGVPQKGRMEEQLSMFEPLRREAHSRRKVCPHNDSTTKHPNSSVSPLKSKNENVSQNLVSKPLVKDMKSSSDGALPSHLTKVPVSFKTWSERKVSWDLLPRPIHDLGKEVTGHRDQAFLAAVHALEEVSAAECVIRCMSLFAELCESSEKDSAGNLVERFLDLHLSMQKAASVVATLLSTRLQEPKTSPYSQRPLPEISGNIPNRNATSWVLAAVETDLSKFCLFKKEERRENFNGEKCNLVVLENSLKKAESKYHLPQCKRSPNSHGSSLSDSHSKGLSPTRKCMSSGRRTDTSRNRWSKGNGLKEATTLADELLLVSRQWFLGYLEDSLNTGFGMRMGKDGTEIASLLRQLKRVNEWLDDSVADGVGSDDRIEGLKKKLYGFLLEHVDFVTVASR